MKCGGLRVADKICDLADGEERVRDAFLGVFPPRQIEELLVREAGRRQAPLECPRRHPQIAGNRLDFSFGARQSRSERSTHIERNPRRRRSTWCYRVSL